MTRIHTNSIGKVMGLIMKKNPSTIVVLFIHKEQVVESIGPNINFIPYQGGKGKIRI